MMIMNNKKDFIILKELKVSRMGQINYNENKRPRLTEQYNLQASEIGMSALAQHEWLEWIWGPIVSPAYCQRTETGCGPCTPGEHLNDVLPQQPA